MADWIKTNDAALRAQAEQFSAYVTAHFAALGLDSSIGVALAAYVAAFGDALDVASNVSTRTKVTIAGKESARVALIADLRSVARRVRANPTVTDGQKTALGIPLPGSTNTRTPAPLTRPSVSIKGVTMTEINVRAVDETTPTSRRKPPGALGLQYFVWVGSEPAPQDLEWWRFAGLGTQSEFTINLHLEDAGKPVTIVARWYTRTGLVGRQSQPVTTGLAVPVYAEAMPMLRQAA